VRILIAGLGAIGQRHARNIRALRADVELIAYRRRRLTHVVTESLTKDESRNVEQQLGITSFDDLDEALKAKPDAAFICTPSSQHLEIALKAAAAECDLFVEKPVSHTIDGLGRLQHLVTNGRLVAMVGCQWRFHPLVVALKELLRAGTLGEIVRADIEYAEYLPDWHPYEDYRESYAARAELGGGVVLTHIHDYDLAWWLFGPPRTVFAHGGHQSELEIDVEDTAHAHLVTPSGNVFISQSFASKPPKRRIVVRGSLGSVTIDLIAGSFEVTPTLAPSLQMPEYQRNEMFRAEVSEFLACCDERRPAPISLGDGVAVLRVALAVKESMRSGRLIELG
jgi:predicted dehydrogenase